MILERRNSDFDVAEVASVIAVGESRAEFSQVALLDRIAAHGAEGTRPRYSAIDQNELHFDTSKRESRTRNRLEEATAPRWTPLGQLDSGAFRPDRWLSTIEIGTCSVFLPPTSDMRVRPPDHASNYV